MQQSLEQQANKLSLTNTQTGESQRGAISMRLGILIVLHLGINMISTGHGGHGKGNILEWSYPESQSQASGLTSQLHHSPNLMTLAHNFTSCHFLIGKME